MAQAEPNPGDVSSASRAPTPDSDEITVDAERERNVAFAHQLLDDELDRREARKESQEAQARAIIVAAAAVATLLVTLARDAGVLSADAPIAARIALIATLTSAALAALCAVGTLWPRKYERIGQKALNRFNDRAFLDQPHHALVGQVLATRIGIAKTMDDRHERKARWMKWAFAMLLAALVGLIVAGVALAVDPRPGPSDQPRIVLEL